MSPTPPPIVVTQDRGVSFAAHIGEHCVIVDQPSEAGGEDRGPAPLDLLGAALGTCIAYYVDQFCRARGLEIEFRVEVTQEKAKSPPRIGRFNVRVIVLDELRDDYAVLLDRVARSCPAHNTLAGGAEVAIAVERAPALV